MNLFPDLSKTEIMERVQAAWDLSGRFPWPKQALPCPVCRGDPQLKQMRFHKRKGIHRAGPYRCDVVLKCTGCGLVWTHGVVISQRMFDAHGATKYTWREVRDEWE